jgi:hypothetical protein
MVKNQIETTSTFSAVEYPPLTIKTLEAMRQLLAKQKYPKLRYIEIGDYVTFKTRFLDKVTHLPENVNAGTMMNILYGVEVRLSNLVPDDEVHMIDALGRVFKKFKI